MMRIFNKSANRTRSGRHYGLWILFAAALVLAMAPRPGHAQARHPMDALNRQEVERAVALIRAAGNGDETSRFPTITLKEMAKEAVLQWQPGAAVTRAADVVMQHQGRTFEIEVDLTGGRVASITEVGGEPGIIIDEWLAARSLTMADPRWLEAMQRRGITDLKTVTCSPITAGYFAQADYDHRRILKVPCYQHRTESSHLYGRPIEGLFSVVDVEAGDVIDVVDLGAVAVAAEPEPTRWQQSPLKPVIMSSPQGANFKVDGAVEIAWQGWTFHTRMDKRVGPIVSLVRYAQNSGEARLIAYQMALSEMFVPYMAPQADWSYRTYLDAGEFGTGALLSSLVPGADCPEQAAYISANIPNDKGQVFQVRRAACLFERRTGDPLWRHGQPAQPTRHTRPEVELVLRSIPTIGNSDYAIDWVFTQQGNIEVRVGATGIVAVRSVASANMDDPGAAADTAHGTLVAPGTVAINHDHFFNFRLDLDVDGPRNTLVRDALVAKRLAEDNPRRSLWVVEPSPVASEGPATGDGKVARWRLVNPNRKTALGHNPGFEIVPGQQGRSLLAEDDYPQRRAAFSAHTLWLTRHKPDELYAAGDYPNLSRGGDGLPAYSGDGDPVANEDLVVWLTLGFHHLPRAEDWPIMPTRWHSFTLRPFNFFSENPAYSVPPGFAQAEPPALRSTIEQGETGQ